MRKWVKVGIAAAGLLILTSGAIGYIARYGTSEVAVSRSHKPVTGLLAEAMTAPRHPLRHYRNP